MFSDPDPGDVVTLAVTGGTGSTAFGLNGTSGAITVADQAQLDYETTPSFTLNVLATDPDGATDAGVITINLNDVLECITTEAQLRPAAAGGSFCVDSSSPIVLTTGEVPVATNLTLTSAGPGNAVIDANRNSRVLAVTGALTLADITVTGGHVDGAGGGITITDASATVTLNGHSSISDNEAWIGGGVHAASFPPGGLLTLNDSSTIANNRAVSFGAIVTTRGGGVSLNSASLTMNGNSTITGNFTEGPGAAGGGVLNNVGTIVMNDSSMITDNEVGVDNPGCTVICSGGGGIYFVNGGSLTLTGSASITGNTALGDGGGIYRIDGGFGTFAGVTAINVTGNSPNNCFSFGIAPAVPGCVAGRSKAGSCHATAGRY